MLTQAIGLFVGTSLVFSLRWFHRTLVATDPVLVSFSIGRQEVVSLILFSSPVADWRDDFSVEDLVACIRLCRFHRNLVAADPALMSFSIGRHEVVALLL